MAIAILSVLLVGCLIYILSNTSSAQNQALIKANKNLTDGLNRLIDAQKNEIACLKEEVIASNKFIGSLAKLSIHQRIEIMECKAPNLKVSQDYVYAIDEIHSLYTKNLIKPNEYFLKLNSTLDEIYPL